MIASARALCGLALLSMLGCGELDARRSAYEQDSDAPGGRELSQATSANDAVHKVERRQHTAASLARAAAQAFPKDAMSRSTKGLVASKDQDGIVKLDLGGRFHHASVAFIGPDGRRHTSCVDGVSSADGGTDAP